jgi:hypothetical protein
MYIEQRIRAILFYLSVLVFIAILPFILSFALGYKFNPKTLQFTKTGIIVLKAQPGSAAVYLNDKLLDAKSPVTIDELLPGNYQVRLEIEGHYPWSDNIQVEAGKVSRFEKIILFPLRPQVTQLNQDRVTIFWIDEDSGLIYYVYSDNKNNQIYIYTSDLSGQRYQMAANISGTIPAPVSWKLSPDKTKILFFNSRQVRVASLKYNGDSDILLEPYFIFDYRSNSLCDIFWHSDSFHLILVSYNSVEALEAQSGARPVELASLNRKNPYPYYDIKTDTLYFMDSQKAPDGNLYENVYKLEMAGNKVFDLPSQFKTKANEENK